MEAEHSTNKTPSGHVDKIKPPKLPKQLKAFADLLISNPSISPTEAWIQTHDTNNRPSASVSSSRQLMNPKILTYMEQHSQMAQQRIVELMSQNDNKRIALDASKDILDRVHGKPTQRVENSSKKISISFNINMDSEEAKQSKVAEPIDV